MNISILLKVVGVGLLVAVAHQILSKSGREDLATWVSIGGIMLVLVLLMNEITSLFNSIRTAFGI